MKLKYDQLSKDICKQIEYDRAHGIVSPYRTSNDTVIRRDMSNNNPSLWRPPFVRDCETILHSNFYNRYTDKTQVFSFYKNDDISRRGLHVQLVSRIARNIGGLLGLNTELIEAIALGHDIGHTPFGHAGERMLDALLCEHTGRHFEHNVHSVRVLDGMLDYNLSLQTLNGILSHNGEMEMERYQPAPMNDFTALDKAVESCYIDKANNAKMVPSTLEGCVVRICDIIAYLGKDRQDAKKAHIIDTESVFTLGVIGVINSEIINNMTVNIVENSYGKPYIAMSKEYFDKLSFAKKENYEKIYLTRNDEYDRKILPLMSKMYRKLQQDLMQKDLSSPIFRYHISDIDQSYYRKTPYEQESIDQIVVDYIASMTDDYFLDLYNMMFPNEKHDVSFKGYFDEV